MKVSYAARARVVQLYYTIAVRVGRRKKSDQSGKARCRLRDPVQVFDDRNHVLIPDRMDEGEQRWHAVGLSGDVPLLVMHVYRRLINGEEEIVRDHLGEKS